MSVYSVTRQTKRSSLPVLIQILAALAGGLVLFSVFIIIFMVGFDLYHSGRIYPGVSVAGVDMSGLSQDQAASLLAERITYPQTGKIVVQEGDNHWVARPSDLGLIMDGEINAHAAYNLGRNGNPFSRLGMQLAAWHSGEDLPPVMFFNEGLARQYLEEIAAQVDRPTVEASLEVKGLEVVAVPGQIGREVDQQASLAPLQEQMLSMTDGMLPLVIEETPPGIMDASQQAETARQVLSAPLTLHISEAVEGDPGPWVIPPDQLAKMLTIERVESSNGDQYQVGLDQDALYTYLSALAADIDRRPVNARFIFNDDTRLLEVTQPAVIGRSLDVYSTIKEANNQVMAGGHDVPLTLATIQPDITDDTSGETLGITELVNAETTYFRGSSNERLQNIQTAAANFHGLLVPPGETFSMASVMGDVSLDTGYAEAWIIFGGRTIKGVGGGVCQVSTTLFRTVFFSGFPIVERYPHAYRVGYYEQTYSSYDDNLAGLDATVFVPMVDFKFINDTPYWLLMETYFNPTSRSLTWKFYSTKDGRVVDWETTGPENGVESPDPVYEENPDLPKGKIKQVDWAAEGADVTVTRTVSRGGLVLFGDTITTHYMPWGDVFQYGPGTKIPGVNAPKKKPPIIILP